MPAPHPLLGPLESFLGTWVGEGQGQLPGRPTFTWKERFEVGHGGTPALWFRQRTTRPDGSPFHAEDGWVRVPPELQSSGADGGDDDGGRWVEVAVASPTGVLEALEGPAGPDALGAAVLDVASTSIAGTAAAAPVDATRRRWTLLDPGTLLVEFWMATQDHPDRFHHLTARLRREEDRP